MAKATRLERASALETDALSGFRAAYDKLDLADTLAQEQRRENDDLLAVLQAENAQIAAATERRGRVKSKIAELIGE